MRIFTPEQEERADRHERLRDWRAAGLLPADRAAAAAALAGDPPLVAAWPLRVLLFALAAATLGALSLLTLKDLHGQAVVAFACWLLAIGAIVAAELLIRVYGLRRFGAEEALVAGAVVLFALGAERLLATVSAWGFGSSVFAVALTLGAAAAYARYGYRLAAFGVAFALSLLVLSQHWDEQGSRLALAGLYAALLAAASLPRTLERRERDRLELLRFLLALAVPLCLNLRLERVFKYRDGAPVEGAFGYATLAAIVLLPLAWLIWGALSRSRALLWAGGLGMLLAQCSFKPYFGLARNSWDPAILGLELVALAFVLKRYLDAGPGGRRGAYSSESLGDQGPGAAATVFAAVAAASPGAPTPPDDRPKGGGGSFGGGGASGGF